MTAWPYWLALGVFVVDQATKWAIINLVDLPARYSIQLLPILSFTWVENRGVSMGLLTAGSDAARWALVAMTAGIAAFVAAWLTRPHALPDRLALGLVLGGAMGNILDRIRVGYVVDFIHLHVGRWSFYVFNVADAAITVGVAILFVRALMSGSGKKAEN